MFDFLNCSLSEKSWQKELRPLFPKRWLTPSPVVQLGQETKPLPIAGATPKALHVQFAREGIKYAPALAPSQLPPEVQKRLSQSPLYQEELTAHLKKWRIWQHDLKRVLRYLVGKQTRDTVKENTFLRRAQKQYLKPLYGPLEAQQRGDWAYSQKDPGEILFVTLLKFLDHYGRHAIGLCFCGKFFPRYTYRRQDYCSPQCREQAKPSREKNKKYLRDFREKKDQQDIAKIQQAAESGKTRDRSKIAQLAGVGSRRVLWLLNAYKITL